MSQYNKLNYFDDDLMNMARTPSKYAYHIGDTLLANTPSTLLCTSWVVCLWSWCERLDAEDGLCWSSLLSMGFVTLPLEAGSAELSEGDTWPVWSCLGVRGTLGALCCRSWLTSAAFAGLLFGAGLVAGSFTMADSTGLGVVTTAVEVREAGSAPKRRRERVERRERGV